MKLLDIKSDFSVFEKMKGKNFSFLDTAASSLKPKVVVNRINQFNDLEASNVHRGAHFLSQQATTNYEEARDVMSHFINAYSSDEVIFTSGTTDSINLVAQSFGDAYIQSGDVILLTELEHHSNIVPWQQVAQKKGAQILFAKVKMSGELDLEDLFDKLTNKVKILSITYCSNVLGTMPPLKEIIEKAHSLGTKVCIDAAQVVSTLKVDVQDLDCDFLTFSAHKMFGPYGVGVLFGKEKLLNEMPPYRCGGSMIEEVTTEGSTFLKSPQRFEAGTPNISGVLGMATAAKYIQGLGYKNILEHETAVLEQAQEMLTSMAGIDLYAKEEKKINVLSFNVRGVHHSDMASILDQEGIATRAGHHCAQPLMRALGVTGTLRASFSIYNDFEDVEMLKTAIEKAKGFFL